MIKIISGTDISPQDWNIHAPHPLQSWQWGEARKAMGIDMLRIGEYGNSLLKNVFQITFHPIPYTSCKIGYLPRSVFPSEEIIEFLYTYGKKHDVIFIKTEPYIKHSEFIIQNSKFAFSSHPLFPQWTQVLNITRSEDELLKAMHPKTRYNIKLAQKKGVYVREESDEKGFEIFSKLYFDTTKRQKYFGHNPQYHKIVWKHLENGISHILIAYHEQTPLAAYELFYFKDTLYYPYGGTSEEKRNLMASNLLMWEAIRLGKKLGAKTFDMWGSLPPDYDEKNPWSGFTKFKQGYGTSFTKMSGSYDLVISPFLYKLYSLSHKLRSLYLNLKLNF